MKFPLAVLVLVLAATQVPYEQNRRFAPEGTFFADSLTFHSDYSIYFSYLRQAAEGRFLFENRVTSEPHDPAFVNVLWWALGNVQGAFDLPWAGMFHLWRVLGATMAIASFWLAGALFLSGERARRVALVVFATGGGLGWIFVFLRWLGLPHRAGNWWYATNAPADTYAAFHPFFQIFLFPFHAFSGGLVVLAICLYRLGESRGSTPLRVAAGLVTATLGFVRPNEMIAVLVTIGLYGLWRAREDGLFSPATMRRTWVVVFSFPVLAFYLWISSAHPIFRFLLEQVHHPPLMPADLALTLGPVLALAVVRLPDLFSRARRELDAALLACWLVAVFALFYSYPFFLSSFEWGNALLAPLALTAFAPGASDRLPRLRSRALVAFLAVNAITSVWLLDHHGSHWARANDPSFFDRRMLEAFHWLETNSSRDDVVMALPDASHWSLRYAGNKVFITSPVSTIAFKTKLASVRAFFSANASAGEQRALLDRYHVAYVLCGRQERALGFDAAGVPGLRPVLVNEGVGLYAVEPLETAPSPTDAAGAKPAAS